MHAEVSLRRHRDNPQESKSEEPLGVRTIRAPPWKEGRRAFADLEQYTNSETHLPPLVAAGLIHAQFETIHPFLDNGQNANRGYSYERYRHLFPGCNERS